MIWRFLHIGITLNSISGKGSTFPIRIPQITIASVVEDRGIVNIDWKKTFLKRSKMLSVDDLTINRELVSEYLKGQPLELF